MHVQRGFHKIDENSHPKNVYHYKKTKDDSNFEGINNDIARFEELNEHFSLNVFEVDNETGDVVRSRKPKSKDAKCHIDLRGIDGDDTSQHACKKDCSRL